MKKFRRKLFLSFLLIVVVISFGTTGYMLLEGWTLLDALYMTIITLSSVGFKEVHNISDNGRIFTLLLIIGGVGTVAYALTAGARLLIEGELQELFGRKRLEKKISELKDHYIVCGYGRMGKIICRELKAKHIRFVVIDKNPESRDSEDGILIYEGDATSDETLKKIGIEKAKVLISVLSSDAENLFVVLSARVLNPRIFIVARTEEEGSDSKLLRAGANKVVSPYHLGGLRIAHTVLKPTVVDFIEFATKSGNLELQMEEIRIHESSELIGLSLDQCGFGRDLGIIIVGIKSNDGKLKFNPTFRSTISAGDTLIALGESSKLEMLENKALQKSKTPV